MTKMAFPSTIFNRDIGANVSSAGMTLRDWFAGQALAGLLADPNVLIRDEELLADVVDNCWRAADAMMASRESK